MLIHDRLVVRETAGMIQQMPDPDARVRDVHEFFYGIVITQLAGLL